MFKIILFTAILTEKKQNYLKKQKNAESKINESGQTWKTSKLEILI